MKEADVVRALKQAAEVANVIVIRMVFRPGMVAGWPDCLMINKFGRMAFVEAKRPGGKPSDLQSARIKQLQSREVEVVVVDTPEAARRFVEAFA